MHSSKRNTDSDRNGHSSTTPTKKRMKQTEISSNFIKPRSEEASRQSTATSESKSVDNEKPSTSREIWDNSNPQSVGLLNVKRKSVANSKLRKSSKIQRIAANAENTSSVGTSQRRGNDEEIIGTSRVNDEKRYAASGSKQSLHGDIYQLKHLTLVLIRARKMGYSFRLATEMNVAEKFDDLVLEYTDNTDKKVHRFVQLKHKQDGTKSIEASKLLADMEREFSVKKYFNSWRKIKKNPAFSGSILKDFILCTNIGLDIEGLKHAQISVSEVTEPDHFLKVECTKKTQRRYKLKANKDSELYKKLKTTSDIHQLAQVLARRVRDSKKLDLTTDIIKRYRVFLAQDVIDVQNKKLSDNFIMNNLSTTAAKRFRDIFSKQLLSNEHASENAVRKRLEACRLSLSDEFGKNLPLTHESGLKQVTELPNDKIEDVDISDFLNVFTIAVDQPNEVELGEMIKQELGDNNMFNLLDASLVGDSFQNDILNWFKCKSGVFLNEVKVEAFFEEIAVKLASIMTMGLNLKYLEMFEKCDIVFENENTDLQNFLKSSGSSQKILELFSSKQSFVTALRVHQTLKNIDKYHKNDSCIFLDLEKLLQSKTAKIVSRAFKNPLNHNLLVIDCGFNSAELYKYELWAQLGETIKKNSEKRMILITQGNNGPPVEFKTVWKISHETDEDINFVNQKKCSRQKLLEKEVVKFQGQEGKRALEDY